MTTDKDVLTIPETAALLQVTPMTLRNWRARGEGPPIIRIGTKTVRYRRSAVLEYLKEMERPASR